MFVHPFDDPDVIAGQGTIGMEILRQTGGELDAIFVPVGGGGLIAGIAAYVKQLYPRVKIIGVEPEDAAAMYESCSAGKRVTLERVGMFADGVAVRRVGEETFELVREYVDEILLVNTDEICAAIQDIFEDTRSISEPAGALAVAGIKRYLRSAAGLHDQRAGRDQQRRQHEFRPAASRGRARRPRRGARGAAGGGDPRAARQLPAVLRGARPAQHHRVQLSHQGSERARIFVGFALAQGHEEAKRVVAQLRAAGYPVLDMSGNEMAKLHVRYMIGGRARTGAEPGDELLYRFEFPERPGALLRFLQAIGSALEHQPVPLPQSRLRLRPRAGGHPGAEGRARAVPAAPEGAALSVYR